MTNQRALDVNPTEAADFISAVLHIALVHNASITSYIRTPEHNAAVGGHPGSLHMYGLAADLVFDTPGDRAGGEILLLAYNLHFRHEADHTHVQAYPVGEMPYHKFGG